MNANYCAPTLLLHRVVCENKTLRIDFQQFHFCRRIPTTDIKVKVGKSKVFNSTEIGEWNRKYLDSYDISSVSWKTKQKFFDQEKEEIV